MLDNDKRPGVEERCTSASNTSNLRVSAECGGDGDVLIAMGWSASRLGAALLRLHSEWDVAAKPLRPTKQAVEALASNAGPGVEKKEALAAAQRQAGEWYAEQLRLLVGKLKSLPDVRRELAGRGMRWGMTDAHDKASAVIKHWLDHGCNACSGRKWRLVAGAPALSNKVCYACHGSGIGPTPCGQDGRRLANYLDRCVEDVRGSIKNRLHGIQKGR